MRLEWHAAANQKAREKYVGMVVTTKKDGDCKIVEYHNRDHMVAEFNDGTRVKTSVSQVCRGSIRNPMKPSVRGVGFGGIGKYNSSNSPIAWAKWGNMFERCYCPKYQSERPSYIGVSIDERWYNFQEFAKWFYNQPFFVKGWHLDKDLLVKGNRVYGPDTCCLVPNEVNSLTVNHADDRKAFDKAVEKWRGKIDERVVSALEVWFDKAN